MPSKSPLIAASAVALSLLMSASSAFAECKTMGFTVNDYGKDGPTKDAKELLDKDIAKWAADSGVEKYTVGKKTVKCELFLDVILFDEHTCTASASVCWGAGIGTNTPKTAKEGSSAPKKSATKAAEEKAPVETGAITPEAPSAAKVDTPAPAAAAGTEKPVEAAAAPPAAAPSSTSSDESAAERAAAAAERAAAAAERAAAAAEKAASGNKSASAAEPVKDAGRQISPEGAPKP